MRYGRVILLPGTLAKLVRRRKGNFALAKWHMAKEWRRKVTPPVARYGRIYGAAGERACLRRRVGAAVPTVSFVRCTVQA